MEHAPLWSRDGVIDLVVMRLLFERIFTLAVFDLLLVTVSF